MKGVINFLFFRWTKYEVYKADVPYIQDQFNYSPALGGQKISEDRVLVDIYVSENKFNGLKRYKRVVKYQ